MDIQRILLEILRWAEVWAVTIPISVFLLRQNFPRPLKIVFTYLCIALFLHSWADLSVLFFTRLSGFWKYNNWLYNLHSIALTICFVLFFRSIGLRSKWLSSFWPLVFFTVSVAVIFLFIDDFVLISSKVFALEGLVLLVYCMSFFIEKLKDDHVYLDFDPFLVIVIGLSIFESINFFIFLFFNLLMKEAESFAILIWNAHNVVYIIFCLFITYAFYGRTKFLYS